MKYLYPKKYIDDDDIFDDIIKDCNSSNENKERYHFIINDLENKRLACPFTLVKNDSGWDVDNNKDNDHKKYNHKEIRYYKNINEDKFQINSDEYNKLSNKIFTIFYVY